MSISDRLIWEALPQGILVAAADGRLIACNERAGRLLGAAPVQMLGRQVTAILPALQFEPAGDGSDYELSEPITVHGQPLLASRVALPGGASMLVLTGPAESARILRELETVRTLNRELEAIFDSSSDEIFVTDGEGVCLRVNAASEPFYGLPPESLVGRSVADLERDGVFSPSATLMALRERRPIRMVQTTRTGRRVVVTANPVMDQGGRIVRVVSNSRDVTDLMDLQDQLDALEAKARRYSQELAELRQEVTRLPGLVMNSPAMRLVEAVVRKVAGVDTTVLLLGESGVGKNAIARAIHRLSRRAPGPFIEVNCGAIPETLLESELFGYEGGAFTGARKGGKAGQFELAQSGTLFLNEVGDLPLSLQVKLLHVLQERQVNRVGGTAPVDLDVRLVAATNRNLKQMVAEGRFREDLFYRLNVVPIRIPALRERPEDIPALLQQQLDRLEAQYGMKRRFSGAAVRVLLAYSWPGNVRELQNLTERMVVTSDKEVIDAAFAAEVMGEVRPAVPADPDSGAEPVSLPGAVEAVERRLISEALQRYGSTHRAAEALGVSQSTIARKARQYGLGTP